MKAAFLFSLFTIMFISFEPAWSLQENEIRAGAEAGHVGLLSDVGDRSGNAIGLGVFGNYMASSDLFFELSYLASSHDSEELKHSQYEAGIGYYFDSYDMAYFSTLAGVDFVNHQLGPEQASSTAFGLYGGMGIEFELGSRMIAGLQGKYHWMFDTSVTTNTGSSIKAVQSFITVLARVGFVF